MQTIGVRFHIHDGSVWFEAIWTGALSAFDVADAYDDFYSSDLWDSTLFELVDLSGANLSGFTRDGITRIVPANRSRSWTPTGLPMAALWCSRCSRVRLPRRPASSVTVTRRSAGSSNNRDST